MAAATAKTPFPSRRHHPRDNESDAQSTASLPINLHRSSSRGAAGGAAAGTMTQDDNGDRFRLSNDTLADRIVSGGGLSGYHSTIGGNNYNTTNGIGNNGDTMSVQSKSSTRSGGPNFFRRIFHKRNKSRGRNMNLSKDSLFMNNNNNNNDTVSTGVSRTAGGTTTTGTTTTQPVVNGGGGPIPAQATTPSNTSVALNYPSSSPMSLSTMTTSPVKLMDSSSYAAADDNNNNKTNKKTMFERELPPVGIDSDSTNTNTPPVKQQLETTKSKSKSSWLTRSKKFQEFCTMAFTMVDTDKSGSVDEKELYSGLLLIHLKLGMYLGPAACRPIGRKQCQQVFRHYDDDQDGFLNRDEFSGVMMVLFSNVLIRVLLQWTMTIVFVPMVAHHVLEGFYRTTTFVYLCIVNADEYSSIANSIELSIEQAVDYVWKHLPGWLVVVFAAIVDWWQAVPDSVWNTAPLALISTLLGVLVVPYLIFQVDDFFQYLAARADTDQSGLSSNDNKEEEKEEDKKNARQTTTNTTATATTATPAKNDS